MITIISQAGPDLKNTHFMNHVAAFAKAVYYDIPGPNLNRLVQAILLLKNFNDSKLIREMKHQIYQQVQGQDTNLDDHFNEETFIEDLEKEWANEETSTIDEGYFTFIDSEDQDEPL